MASVRDLIPGDVVHVGGRSATFIEDMPHPLWGSLRLVVWRLDDGSVSLDALLLDQEIGSADAVPAMTRLAQLRAALVGGDPSVTDQGAEARKGGGSGD